MTHPRMSASARWFGIATVLVLASSVSSSWRPGPSGTVVNVSKLLPPIFTASSAQGPLPTIVCTKKPAAGETASVVMNSATAISASNVARSIWDETTPRSVNVAGSNGPAGFFAQALTLQPDVYTTFEFVMDSVITVKGSVTCSPAGGPGLITIWTGGNPDRTVADPKALADNPLDPSDDPTVAEEANPQLTSITIDGGDTPFQLPVNFTVVAGATTVVRTVFNTDGNAGLVVYDISSVTGIPQSYKIVPGNPDVTGATVE